MDGGRGKTFIAAAVILEIIESLYCHIRVTRPLPAIRGTCPSMDGVTMISRKTPKIRFGKFVLKYKVGKIREKKEDKPKKKAPKRKSKVSSRPKAKKAVKRSGARRRR